VKPSRQSKVGIMPRCSTRLSAAFALTPTILALACGSETSPADGADVPLPWFTTAEWTRGGSGDASLFLTSLPPNHVAALPGGEVAVLDFREGTVRILDSTGADVRSLGRRGSGPGELERPFGIAATPDGGLAALDPLSLRIVRWNTIGSVQSELRAPEGLEEARFAVGDGWVQAVITDRDSAGHKMYALVRDHGTWRDVLATSSRAEYSVGDFPACGASRISSYPLLAPRIVWANSGNLTAVSTTSNYEVEVLRGTEPAGTIRRSILPAATDSTIAAYHARGRTMNGCPLPPMDVVRAFGFAPQTPVIAALAFAPGGELLVTRRVGGMKPVVDVFGEDLAYRGTLAEAFPLPTVFIDTERFVSIDRDSFDVPVVRQMQLRRGAGQ
jgi:hypothetical protein